MFTFLVRFVFVYGSYRFKSVINNEVDDEGDSPCVLSLCTYLMCTFGKEENEFPTAESQDTKAYFK